MNIKELKELIKNIPDDVELHHNEVPDSNYELTASYSEKYCQLEFWVRKRADKLELPKAPTCHWGCIGCDSCGSKGKGGTWF